MSTTRAIHNPTGHLAAAHPRIVKLGRVGWFAKGVVYLLAGVLALVVAARSTGWTTASGGAKEASPTGAIKEVAHSSGGPLVLVVLAIGLFLYAAWRVVTALLPGSTDAKGSAIRIGYIASAIFYTTLGITAISLSRSKAAPANGNQKVTDLTARIMDHTAGRWFIGLLGVILLATALYRAGKGLRVDVTDEMDLGGMSAERVRWTRRLGAIGEVGRGIAIGLIGFFLLRAAIKFNAAEATGLDGALRRILDYSWGALVVTVVGIGFVAYGVFCLVTFTHRRLQAP